MIEADQPLLVQRDAPYPVVVRPATRVQQLRTSTEEPVALREAGQPPVVVLDGKRCGMAKFEERRPVPVQRGFVGPRGPQGPSGSAGAAIEPLPAGAVVQGLRIVRAVDGVALPVDTAQEAHASEVAGLALQSVTVLGEPVDVQTAGVVSDSSWAWSPGVVWCGNDGALTQSPSTTGWLMQVGRVIAPTRVAIDIEPPIYRG